MDQSNCLCLQQFCRCSPTLPVCLASFCCSFLGLAKKWYGPLLIIQFCNLTMLSHSQPSCTDSWKKKMPYHCSAHQCQMVVFAEQFNKLEDSFFFTFFLILLSHSFPLLRTYRLVEHLFSTALHLRNIPILITESLFNDSHGKCWNLCMCVGLGWLEWEKLMSRQKITQKILYLYLLGIDKKIKQSI